MPLINRQLKKRAAAYKAVFNQETTHAKNVLAHLKRECRGGDSVYSNDPIQMARMAGRQEIYNMIVKLIELSEFEADKLTEQYGA